MKIFVTGASGYIGSAICNTLVKNGYSVTGSTRNEGNALKLKANGITPVIFDIKQPKEIELLVSRSDVIIHAAFNYDSTPQIGIEIDNSFVNSIINLAHKKENPPQIIYTSNAFLNGGTINNPLTEYSTILPNNADASRIQQERKLLDLLNENIFVSVVRVGMVYGSANGSLSDFFEISLRKREVPYIEEGENHWAMIHLDDLSKLYLRIIEERAIGIFHGVDNESPTFRQVVEAIAKVTAFNTIPTSISINEASKIWGDFATTLSRDVIVRSQRGNEICWIPERKGFLENAQDVYQEWHKSMEDA